MPRPRDDDRFYRDFTEYGLELTLKERANGRIYLIGSVEGERVRKSMKTDDPELAEQRGREVAREIARKLLNADADDELHAPTVGEILNRWRELKKPTYDGSRPRIMDQRATFLEGVWGSSTPVSHLDQDDVERAVRAVMGREGVDSRTTAKHYLTAVQTIFNWATRKKADGSPLLEENPLTELRFPRRSENGAQPVASHGRFLRTLPYARHTAGSQPGATVTALVLARYQGRRKDAIRRLREGDICLEHAQLRAKLAQAGASPKIADYWPHGAVVWRKASDKLDRTQIVPLHPTAARVLRYHRRRMARHGLAGPWLFPSPDQPGPVDSSTFADWLTDAEELAREAGEDVPDLARGLWHPYRRLWRAERARFHPKAIAYAGGWKYDSRVDTPMMNRGYLPVPPDVLQEVVAASPEPDRRTVGTADERLWSFEGLEDQF